MLGLANAAWFSPSVRDIFAYELEKQAFSYAEAFLQEAKERGYFEEEEIGPEIERFCRECPNEPIKDGPLSEDCKF